MRKSSLVIMEKSCKTLASYFPICSEANANKHQARFLINQAIALLQEYDNT